MTTETPKEECQRLLDVLLPFAAQMLSEHGEFFPFGATMSATGEIEAAAGWTGEVDVELIERDVGPQEFCPSWAATGHHHGLAGEHAAR